MQKLSSLDAAFWALEDSHASLHIASTAVFEGPAPTVAELRHFYRHKLHLVPRLRQRLHMLPMSIVSPSWEDDQRFELADHLGEVRVPSPGGSAELSVLIGELMSTHLDPRRPLWHVWLVDGLERGRWAIVSKFHHSMLDGVAGMALLNDIFDTAPDSPLPPADHWVPAPPRSAVGIVQASVRDAIGNPSAGGRAVADTVLHPRRSLQQLWGISAGLAAYARALWPTPDRHLTGPLGSPRSYRMTTLELGDIATVRNALGGSINDVVIAVVTSAFRDLLTERGEPPTPNSIRCLVPVSVRGRVDAEHDGNLVSALLAELPVEFADPVDRYAAVVARTRRLKSSHEIEAGTAVTAVSDHIPAMFRSAALRAVFRLPQRSLTTVVTNVPGPRVPVYVLGRRMVAMYPYVPIANRVRIGIAVASYAGRLFLGVTADRASVRDVEVLTCGVDHALEQLLDHAGSARAAP